MTRAIPLHGARPGRAKPGPAARQVVLFAALLSAVVGPPLVLPGGGPAAWAVSGELARPRAYASALALPTGEIFVFGGLDERDPQVVSTTTELIDPLTGTTRTLPQRLPGRLHHTMTLAWADRVVVAGGVEWYGGSFHSTDRVDVYLPYQHRWIQAAPLLQARSDHGAAPLPDGRVLVTGGNFNAHPLASSELYDPRTDRWTEAAPLPAPRVRFSMTALPDGRVLVAGGLSQIGQPLGSSAIYEPDRDRWVAGPNLAFARVQHATVTLPSGDVLFIGGQFAASNTAERYDVRRNIFTFAGTLIRPRLVEQAVVLPDGRALITGGSLEVPGRMDWVPVADAEVWDPATNLWSAFASPSLPRALGDLVATREGLYLIGGVGDGLAARQTIERLVLP
ncbi:MAG TPA: kelch repeat-containing protein [Candidatus Limnocylindria bacterium]|nr:kelch repeat-containing protein [Candidatus Limnocylindria bacterium]